MQVMTTPFNPLFFSSANPPVCGKGEYPLEMRKNQLYIKLSSLSYFLTLNKGQYEQMAS